MRFCLFTANEPQGPADMCVTTIRYHHSEARIVHLTDEDTPKLAGADEVWRGPWDKRMDSIMGLRMRHLATLDDAPTVILDTDILLRRPVGDVFRHRFDVALTRREEPYGTMPFNTGVMFSRCSGFWRAMLKRMDEEPRYRAFLYEQEGVALEAKCGKWDVFVLTMDEWNCANMNNKKIPPARILHYKGTRKQWMAPHFDRKVWQ